MPDIESTSQRTLGMDETKPSVLDRMKKLGWELHVCDDTCETQWFKFAPGSREVRSYHPGSSTPLFMSDLERCQLEYGYDKGESHYA